MLDFISENDVFPSVEYPNWVLCLNLRKGWFEMTFSGEYVDFSRKHEQEKEEMTQWLV
jgi:hypothetical protein